MRLRYLRRYSSLRNVLSLLVGQEPDVVVINELVLQLHKDELEAKLPSLGYMSWAWGPVEYYSDATIASLVACRQSAMPVEIPFPKSTYVGSGAGIAGLRLVDNNITLVAIHMSYLNNVPWEYESQIKALAAFVTDEQSHNRCVVIAGDWNAPSRVIQGYPDFKKLNLINAEHDVLTCPTFLPKLRPYDHVFMPEQWKAKNVATHKFGSDHLAVSVTAEIP